jgi:hypothetical protein
LRRAVGFKLDTVETYLQSYVDFATSRGDTHVVSTTVIDWATNARSDDARARRLDLHSARRGHNLARISSLVRRAKGVFRDAE